MKWEEIPAGTFDENNPQHVQALQELCQSKCRNTFTLGQKRGWKVYSPTELTEVAEKSVGPNISIEDQFNRDLIQLDTLGGSEYWWKWVLQIAEWWRNGYLQAQSQPVESPGK